MTRLMLTGMIAWLVAASAAAQPRIVDPASGSTIAALVERAVAREPSLQAARLAVEAAEARVRQARLRPNPKVSATHEQARSMDKRTMASIGWPLDLGRRGARVDVAAREKELADLELTDRRRQLTADVADAAAQALGAARRLAVAEELHGAATKFASLVDARVKEGATPEIEGEYATIELRRIDTERLAALGELEEAQIRLRSVVGDEPGVPILLRNDLEREAAQPDPPQPPDAGQHVHVRAARATVDLIAARIAAARSQGRLDAEIMASYSRMTMGFHQLGLTPAGGTAPILGTFNMIGGGITLNWPLRNRNQGEVAALEAELKGAEALEQRARLSAAAEIDAARARLLRARQALDAFRAGVREPARRALEVLREAYQLGRTPLLDVLAEQRRVLEIEREYTDALESVVRARIALERAFGVVS
jgi:cobalt-zinc-cadmium efflux system outer membrane protein